MNIKKIIELLQQILDVAKQILGLVQQQPEEVKQTEQTNAVTQEEPEEFRLDILREMIAFDEGKVLKIYRDSLGYYTVGIGHLLTKKDSLKEAISILDQQVGRNTNGNITNDEAAMLFEKDLEVVLKGVKRNTLLNEVYQAIDPTRRLALLNMVFQLGEAGTANFKNSMRNAINNDWTKLESNLKQSLWYKQTKNRATRVIQVFSSGNLDAYSKYIKV